MLSGLSQGVISNGTVSEWEWAAELAAPTRIYRRYSSRASLAIPGRETLTFDRVLVPIHSHRPDFVYLRRGAEVMCLAMYDAWVYVRLATEAGVSVDPSWLAVERSSW